MANALFATFSGQAVYPALKENHAPVAQLDRASAF
jgi:hypothetical protein